MNRELATRLGLAFCLLAPAACSERNDDRDTDYAKQALEQAESKYALMGGDELRDCLNQFHQCSHGVRACADTLLTCVSSAVTSKGDSPGNDNDDSDSGSSTCEISSNVNGVEVGVRCETADQGVTCTCRSAGAERTCTQAELICSSTAGCCAEGSPDDGDSGVSGDGDQGDNDDQGDAGDGNDDGQGDGDASGDGDAPPDAQPGDQACSSTSSSNGVTLKVSCRSDAGGEAVCQCEGNGQSTTCTQPTVSCSVDVGCCAAVLSAP